MSDEQTYTCERCHHAYTERYGRWVSVVGGEQWLCFECITERNKKRGAR